MQGSLGTRGTCRPVVGQKTVHGGPAAAVVGLPGGQGSPIMCQKSLPVGEGSLGVQEVPTIVLAMKGYDR